MLLGVIVLSNIVGKIVTVNKIKIGKIIYNSKRNISHKTHTDSYKHKNKLPLYLNINL